MTVLISPNCAQRLMAGATIPTQFNGGAIKLYAGSMPISAELPPAGALLGTVKNHLDGGPVFMLSENSALLHTDFIWRVELISTGVPAYLRIEGNSSNLGSVIYTDQINLPLITTTGQQLDLNTFYVTLLTE